MKTVIPCIHCSNCVAIQPAGFLSVDMLMCDLSQIEVSYDDGCTLGERGLPRRGRQFPEATIEGHEAVYGY